jgi:hypothetical protein
MVYQRVKAFIAALKRASARSGGKEGGGLSARESKRGATGGGASATESQCPLRFFKAHPCAEPMAFFGLFSRIFRCGSGSGEGSSVFPSCEDHVGDREGETFFGVGCGVNGRVLKVLRAAPGDGSEPGPPIDGGGQNVIRHGGPLFKAFPTVGRSHFSA